MQLKRGVKQRESILGEYPFSSYFPKWIQKVTEIQLCILISTFPAPCSRSIGGAEVSGGTSKFIRLTFQYLSDAADVCFSTRSRL